MQRSRSWCITAWLDNVPSREALENLFNCRDGDYGCYQLERGTETEDSAAHWQIYLEYTNARSFASMQRRWSPAHIEPRKKGRNEAREYCRKDDGTQLDGPWEVGTWVPDAPGTRTDIERLYDTARSGKSLRQLWDDPETGVSMLKYYRGVAEMRTQLQLDSERNWPTAVWVLWGPTGTGKSKRAMEYCSKGLDTFRFSGPNTRGGAVW